MNPAGTDHENTTPKGNMNHSKKIVILQRGWVIIGDETQRDDTEAVYENASVIRYWGTTEGIGQLALNGPTPKTKLDPAGTVRTHPLAIVMTIDVDETKW